LLCITIKYIPEVTGFPKSSSFNVKEDDGVRYKSTHDVPPGIIVDDLFRFCGSSYPVLLNYSMDESILKALINYYIKTYES